MHIPRAYAEWSACLDRLAEGTQDEACLDCMRQGELSWSGGVATLFSQRVVAEFNARLTRCSEHLTRDLRVGADENLIIRAILNARYALHFLHRLAQLASFPETLRTHLTDEVRKFAQRAQESLENSAKTDRSGRLPVLLRNNTLLRYDALPDPALSSDAGGGAASRATAAPLSAPPSALNPSAATGAVRRRNILT